MGQSTLEIPTANSWDEYFYNICLAAAGNSKCFSRKIGAILVRDKRVVSTGYNGPPEGIPRCDERWKIDNHLTEQLGRMIQKAETQENIDKLMASLHGHCPRLVMGFKSGEGLDWCIAGHAEENAILSAARLGIATKGTTMYMTCGIPCSKCLVKIINAGIHNLVVTSFNLYDVSSEYLVKEAKLNVRLFDFLKK